MIETNGHSGGWSIVPSKVKPRTIRLTTSADTSKKDTEELDKEATI